MKAIRIATLAAALCVGMTTVAAAQSTEPPQQGQGKVGARLGIEHQVVATQTADQGSTQTDVRVQPISKIPTRPTAYSCHVRC